MNFDFDWVGALTAALYVAAVLLPLSLIAVHTAEHGWGFRLPLFAGLAAVLATIGMAGRVSAFLEQHLAEPAAGWFGKDLYIALVVAFLGVISLALYGALLPSMRGWLNDAFGVHERPIQLGGTEPEDFDLADQESRGAGFFGRLLRRLFAGIKFKLGLVLIVAYIAWPALILIIDQHRATQENTEATILSERRAAEAADLRAEAIQLASNANALSNGIASRIAAVAACSTCTDIRQKYVTARNDLRLFLKSLGIEPKRGVYDVKNYEGALTDRERIDAVRNKINALARENGVALNSAGRMILASYQPFTATAAADAVEERRGVADDGLVDQLLQAVGDYRKIFASLTRDLTMAFCLGMELVAMLLAFAVGPAVPRRDPSE